MCLASVYCQHAAYCPIAKPPLSLIAPILITIAGWGTSATAQAQAVSISFADYGPVAFDAFGDCQTNAFQEYPLVRTASRFSIDAQQSRFFTQYLRADIPLGGSIPSPSAYRGSTFGWIRRLLSSVAWPTVAGRNGGIST